MGRNIKFAQEEIYHIYNRGTEKRNIFKSSKDYRRFLCLLYICNGSAPVDLKLQGSTLYDLRQIDRGKRLVNIVSYCLMPNHFHFLLTEMDEGGISKFMQKLVTAYTMYFNKRHERTGALFQGKFKAKHASINDNYLKYLVAYIHLNPVKLIEPNWKDGNIKNTKQIKAFLKTYGYSSYVDFLPSDNDRIEKIILDTKTLPKYFGKDWENFETKITEWLEYNQEI